MVVSSFFLCPVSILDRMNGTSVDTGKALGTRLTPNRSLIDRYGMDRADFFT